MVVVITQGGAALTLGYFLAPLRGEMRQQTAKFWPSIDVACARSAAQISARAKIETPTPLPFVDETLSGFGFRARPPTQGVAALALGYVLGSLRGEKVPGTKFRGLAKVPGKFLEVPGTEVPGTEVPGTVSSGDALLN